MSCKHEHTGSCSTPGQYLYVTCQDCGEILNESAEGKRLRESCPGFEYEHRNWGSCRHCHHDAMYHIRVLTGLVAALTPKASTGLPDNEGAQRIEGK